MRRILVLGDIHIGDYPRYNGVTNRLKQFDKLADRLCARIVDDPLNTASDVIIAGDLLLSCVMKPRAVHCVKTFIEKLCNRFENVYYILGNHDVDIKLRKFYGQEDDTLITLLDSIPNFKYMHDKHEMIEGVDFYFMDWIRGSEVPLTQKSDIFISHINLMPRFGQQVDNKLFKLGIFGDYHARFQTENMITTGTPIQHYVSDPTDPEVIILDVDNGNFEWKRVPIQNNGYEFLRIFKEENAPRALGSLDVVVKAKVIEKKPEFEKLKVSLDSKLDTILEERGLKDIHANVLSVTGDIEPIDMNFEIKKLDILDFRSIKELHVRFDEGKLMFLNGANGSGKTSFIMALKVALFGDRGIKRFIRHGCNYTEVDIEIFYQGRTHTIARAPGYLAYKIDDKQQDANNMAAMQGMIEKNLPFLGFLGDFLVNSHTTFFSSCNRLGLISRLFGLDRYSMYATEANKQKSYKEGAEVNRLKNEIANAESTIKANKDIIDRTSEVQLKVDEKYEKWSISDIEAGITELNTARSNIENLRNKIALASKDLDLKYNVVEYDNIKKSNDSEIELAENSLKDVESKLSSISMLRTHTSQLKELKEVQSKSSHTTLCPKCGEVVCIDLTGKTVLDSIKDLQNRIEDLTSVLVNCDEDKLKLKKSDLQFKIHQFRDENKKLEDNLKIWSLKNSYELELNELIALHGDLDVIKSKMDELFQIKSSYYEKIRIEKILEDSRNAIKSAEELKAKKEVELNSLNQEIELYNKYLSMFSFSNRDGIPYQTLNMVTDSISDEEITFTTDKELSSGKMQFRVSCTMNVDGDYMDFDDLSDGQQAFASLKILSKLSRCLPGLGLVMLDEPLKHVDEGRVHQCIDLIKNTQANHIILSSHSPSFNYADRVLTFSLESGVTNVVEES